MCIGYSPKAEQLGIPARELPSTRRYRFTPSAMNDYVKWMIQARDCHRAFDALVVRAKRLEPHGALFGLLGSYLSYRDMRPHARMCFGVSEFCEVIAEHFPLSDERLWCWNVKEDYDAESRGDFVANRTCATFLMGRFSTPVGDYDPVSMSYASTAYDPAHEFFVSHASFMVLFRTTPATNTWRLSTAVRQRMHVKFVHTCNTVAHMIDLTSDDMMAVYMRVRHKRDICGDFLMSHGGQKLIDRPEVVVTAVYMCIGIDGHARERWAQRGANVMGGSVDPVRFIAELKSIDYDAIGLGHSEDIAHTFTAVCRWASPDQRVSILHEIDTMNPHQRAELDPDLLGGCISACTPWAKNACG